MADYDNNNRGIMSKNDRKEKDTHPDYNGKINVEGKDYYLNAWVKERKDGSGKFFSLSVKEVGEKKSGGERKVVPLREELNDDIPF